MSSTKPFSLRQIEVFRAVMLSGSISGAGRMLHVSQPAISRVIALAEMRLGYPLFHRAKSRLQPTPEASRLFVEVERLYQHVESVNDLAVSLGQAGNGPLKLISSASFEQRMVPLALQRLYETNSDAKIDFRNTTYDQMVGHFLSGRAHLAITMRPADNPCLISTRLGSNPMVCIVPKGHELEVREHIEPADIAHHQWVTYPADAPLGEAIRHFFQSAKQPPSTIEVHSPSTAVKFVMQGLGIALVDLWSLSLEVLPFLTIKPITPSEDLSIWATYSTVSPLPLMGSRLLDAVQHVLQHKVIQF